MCLGRKRKKIIKSVSHIKELSNEVTIKDHKKYVLFLKDQINMKNFMRTKIILFKFYKNSKHILPYFILPLVIYCILYIR